MTRLFSFFFALILTSSGLFSVAHAESIGGSIHRFGGQFLVSLSNENGRLFRISSPRSDTTEAIKKLEQGDYIMASAFVDRDAGSISVDSIDFVGLRRIIGMWNTSDAKGMMTFRNYWDLNVDALVLQESGPRVARRNFKYTVTPSEAGNWVMFLSDDKETQMALLEVSKSTATIRLLNSQNGSVQQVIQLQKLAK
jgi:hypothetical protein